MTTEPSAGPASAYPTFRTPAVICFMETNDVFVPGLIVGTSAGLVLPGCASADPTAPNRAAAIIMEAVPRKRRRRKSASSDIFPLRLDCRSMLSNTGAAREPAGWLPAHRLPARTLPPHRLPPHRLPVQLLLVPRRIAQAQDRQG